MSGSTQPTGSSPTVNPTGGGWWPFNRTSSAPTAPVSVPSGTSTIAPADTTPKGPTKTTVASRTVFETLKAAASWVLGNVKFVVAPLTPSVPAALQRSKSTDKPKEEVRKL